MSKIAAINLQDFLDFITDKSSCIPTMVSGEISIEAIKRAITAEAEIVELKAALTLIMRAAEGAKENCGSDPESPGALRNSALASIAAVAAQGLGLVGGVKLSEGV